MNLKAKGYLGQSQAVYAWQDHIFSSASPISANARINITLAEAQQITDMVWKDLGYGEPPIVRDGRGISYARASRRFVHLPKLARWRGCLMHELAHSLSIEECGFKFKAEGYSGHGPAYVKLAMHLFERYLDAERGEMLRELHRFNIVTE